MTRTRDPTRGRRRARWRRVVEATIAVAVVATFPSAARATENAVCVAQTCTGATYAAVSTTGDAHSSQGVAVSATGSASGGTAAVSGLGYASGPGTNVGGQSVVTATDGGLTLGIQVSGSLPTFPCAGHCRTNFGGVTTPSALATVTGHAAGAPVPSTPTARTATFSLLSGWATGWADYNEPGTPLCPGKGTAAGHVDVSAQAVGAVVDSGGSTVGEVYAVYLGASFSYDRVGSTAAILASGWMRIYFHSPAGYSYFDASIVGGGGGNFNPNPVQVATACLSSGHVDYEVIAQVLLENRNAPSLPPPF